MASNVSTTGAMLFILNLFLFFSWTTRRSMNRRSSSVTYPLIIPFSFSLELTLITLVMWVLTAVTLFSSFKCKLESNLAALSCSLFYCACSLFADLLQVWMGKDKSEKVWGEGWCYLNPRSPCPYQHCQWCKWIDLCCASTQCQFTHD